MYRGCKAPPPPCAFDVRPAAERNENSDRTFAPSMQTAVTDPEKDPMQQDELERLEQLHQRMKDEQEAWRKLLENMGKLNPEPNTNTEPQKSNT